MMHISPLKSITIAALLLGAGWGCGGGSGSMAPLVSVKGKVTYKGQPLTKGIVHFEPDGYGRPASGELQADGTFVLTTLQKGDGVVAGEHKVSVTDTGSNPRKELVPKKYTSPNSSELTADVNADHTEFTFDLQ
jgi:hypothetical protein